MQNKYKELLSFLNFPIEQFPDHSAKWLLEDKENVRGLLEIISENLISYIDFDQLIQVETSFIPDNLRKQESDILYTVPFSKSGQTEELMIYILIEHQSTIDTTMGFRVLFYMTQIWDSQRRQWESDNTPKGDRRLRPIIPIVFYTGERKWRTPIALPGMMDLPDELSAFVPKYDTLFLSVKETEAGDLTRSDHPFGWLLTVLQKELASKDEIADALINAVRNISSLSDVKKGQWERAIFYLYLLIFHRRQSDEHDDLKNLVHQQTIETSHKAEGEEMAQTMAEYLREQGMIEGEKRGVKIGEKQGEKRGEIRAKREVVLKLLHIQFETIPEHLTKKISLMRSVSRLDSLIEKVATAENLDEIKWE